ncbi:hypothetical protein XENOCAPTIV_028210 [Xenoophorus captivus]|uniref:SOCS box domain-containing protein n=1 Tax=Xenoophorus captivus TaxID=1517983 RepID=A0ABV0QEX3_9TELE
MGQSLLPCFHRDSGQPDVFFTLSYQSEDGPTSVRVLLNNLLFSLHGSQKTFTSLFALLAFYTSSPCKLTEPYRRQRPERLKQMCRRALVRTHGVESIRTLRGLSPDVKAYVCILSALFQLCAVCVGTHCVACTFFDIKFSVICSTSCPKSD